MFRTSLVKNRLEVKASLRINGPCLVSMFGAVTIHSHSSSPSLPMRLPPVHVTVGRGPAVQLCWQHSAAPGLRHILQPLCQGPASSYSFLMLVFGLMLFVLDNLYNHTDCKDEKGANSLWCEANAFCAKSGFIVQRFVIKYQLFLQGSCISLHVCVNRKMKVWPP